MAMDSQLEDALNLPEGPLKTQIFHDLISQSVSTSNVSDLKLILLAVVSLGMCVDGVGDYRQVTEERF